MRAMVEFGLAVLGIVAGLLVVGAAVGAMLGSLVGVLLLTVESIAGPVASMQDGASAWWVLCALALVVAMEAVRGPSRRHGARPTQPTNEGGSA